ncbi:MAG: hypothetical protein JWO94_2879 [Verrucomicrobiaceae bacterium]|nr:hypothetical protein [Verrucomicrobiaceae bacterium]
MKTTITSLLSILAIAGSLQAGSATSGKIVAPEVTPAPDDSLGFSLTAGYDSAYIFRGVKYGDSLISAGITAPIKLDDKTTLTFTPWYGHIAGKDYDELDLPVSLTHDFGFATLGLGYTWYRYPFSGFDTSEPNVTFSKTIGNLTIYGGAYLDVNAKGGDLFANRSGDPGWYFETGAAYTIKLTNWLSLVPEAKISYGEDYYGVKGFNNVVVKVTAPIALSKNATLAPYVAGSIAIDSLHDLGVDNYFIGGVALTVTF